jgi:hypothetical protein
VLIPLSPDDVDMLLNGSLQEQQFLRGHFIAGCEADIGIDPELRVLLTFADVDMTGLPRNPFVGEEEELVPVPFEHFRHALLPHGEKTQPGVAGRVACVYLTQVTEEQTCDTAFQARVQL